MKIFENFLLESAALSSLDPVITFMGKFQPFHNGHLESIQNICKEYDLPMYLFYSNNTKNRKISLGLTERILGTVQNNNKNLIVEVEGIQFGNLSSIITKAKSKGYNVLYHASGEDRMKDYEAQINRIKSGKYASAGITCDPELKVVNAQTIGGNQLHATELRYQIKHENRDFYKQNTPEYLHMYFDELYEDLNSGN